MSRRPDESEPKARFARRAERRGHGPFLGRIGRDSDELNFALAGSSLVSVWFRVFSRSACCARGGHRWVFLFRSPCRSTFSSEQPGARPLRLARLRPTRVDRRRRRRRVRRRERSVVGGREATRFAHLECRPPLRAPAQTTPRTAVPVCQATASQGARGSARRLVELAPSIGRARCRIGKVPELGARVDAAAAVAPTPTCGMSGPSSRRPSCACGSDARVSSPASALLLVRARYWHLFHRVPATRRPTLWRTLQ